MVRSVRRLSTAGAALALLFATTAPVAGVEAPGTLTDGTVRVTFSGPDGSPIAGAEVELAVRASDLPEDPPVQELSGVTDAAGLAVFEGVARPDAGGPLLDVGVVAALTTETEDEDGCPITTSYVGSALAPAAPLVELDIVAVVSSDGGCSGPLLRGTVSDPDGAPFKVSTARVTMAAPDGGAIARPFEVAEDGSFEVDLAPWGTADDPAQVRITIVGAATEFAIDDDCVESSGPLAEATFDVALADGSEPEPVDLVARIGVIAVVCGDTGSPGPTLPPTDGFGNGAAGASGPGVGSGAALAVLIGLCVLAATSFALQRRGERRQDQRRP